LQIKSVKLQINFKTANKISESANKFSRLQIKLPELQIRHPKTTNKHQIANNIVKYNEMISTSN